MLRFAGRLVPVVLSVLLAGCATEWKDWVELTDWTQQDESILINVRASEQLNPYLGAGQNPLFIQVLQLKSVDGFQALDFYSLYNEPARALGDGLVYLEHPFPIKPGESLVKDIHPEKDTRFIGLFYFFNDFEHATTRHWFPVQGKRQCLDVFLSNTQGVLESCK